MKEYEIEILGEDSFCAQDTIKAQDIDEALTKAKKLIISYQTQTIEKLRVSIIEERY